MKKIIDWIKYQYNSIWNIWHLKQKIKEADYLHSITGKRYHVVPISQTRLGVIDKEGLKDHNKGLPKKARLNHVDLLKQAYYSTSCQSPVGRK